MRRLKKPKWKRIVLWSIVTLFVLTTTGIIAVNYAVNKVINSMAESFEPDLSASGPPSSILSHSPSPSGSMQSDIPAQVGTSTQSQGPEKSSSGLSEPIAQPTMDASKQHPQASSFDDKEQDKPGSYSSEVSTQKAEAIKEEVTLSEKATVTSILAGNLSLSDMKLFQEMASGGMTVEEKREARKLLLDKLTPEEYNKLVEIAKKYGVSQGKTYDQAEQEEADASRQEQTNSTQQEEANAAE